jgi:hypothetical protein
MREQRRRLVKNLPKILGWGPTQHNSRSQDLIVILDYHNNVLKNHVKDLSLGETKSKEVP